MVARPRSIDLARCIRRFGLTTGLNNWMQASCSRRGTASLALAKGRRTSLRRGSTDWETFAEVFLDQCYRDDFTELLRASRPREAIRTVVDVGANVGYSAIYFRARYPNATVLAIEPDADNFEMLRNNIDGDPAIHAVHGALWNEHAPVAFEVDRAANAGRVRTFDGGCDAVVQGYTMADVLEMIPGNHIDVLKIDVEGAERFIFAAGCTDWLDHVDLMFIELHDWKEAGSTRAYHDALSHYDYAEFALGGTVGTVLHGRRATT